MEQAEVGLDAVNVEKKANLDSTNTNNKEMQVMEM